MKQFSFEVLLKSWDNRNVSKFLRETVLISKTGYSKWTATEAVMARTGEFNGGAVGVAVPLLAQNFFEKAAFFSV